MHTHAYIHIYIYIFLNAVNLCTKIKTPVDKKEVTSCNIAFGDQKQTKKDFQKSGMLISRDYSINYIISMP